MSIIEKFRPWFGRKSVRGAFVVGIIIAVGAGYFLTKDKERASEEEIVKTVVSVITPIEYAGGESLSLIGNVRAFSEARVTSERAGRVVSVNVSLGQQIFAGAIIASLENASERASVLQAEGVYDAAVAATAQSSVGIDEAKNSLLNAQKSAVSVFKTSYNTTNSAVLNTIDTFFSNPNDRIIGLKIDGRGFTSELNAERIAYQTLLPAWQANVNTISTQSDLMSELDYASLNVQRTIDLVDTFLFILTDQPTSGRYSNAELLTFRNTFSALRASLIGVQSSIDSAETALSAAEDTVRRAEINGPGSTNSAADAQVKQALGALRSAQANLAKTILRTPISGTVNSLSIRTGDFINSFAQVAIIANNNALEVITYISDSERKLLSQGDKVMIEGSIEGTVTQIAPAVDVATRKTEVRIATEDANITNGDTVRITKTISTEQLEVNTIRVPLTAIKFDRENGSIFMIEDGVLVSKPVILGDIFGGSVEIKEGLIKEDQFVVDSRGLVAGTEVTISN